MIVLNEKEMWQAVTLYDVMDAVEKAYELHRLGKYRMPDRSAAPNGENVMMYMPCFSEEYMGTKMLVEIPGNPARKLPFLSGMMILNDGVTGELRAVMNGSALTAMRTGAVGGLAAKYLSKEESRSTGLVGCGTQGFHQLLYICRVRPVKSVFLYDKFSKSLDSYAERLKERIGGIEVSICKCSEELVNNSDIIVSATQAKDPVYPNDEKLLKGKCIIAVGSWRPEKREVPDAVFKLIKNVYTDIPYACEESGDLKIPLDTGVLKKENVKYFEDLIHDVKNGKPHAHSDTTYFKTVGMGLFDLCTAQTIYEKAIEKSIGQSVNW